jgi:hypothetical protein
MSAVVGLGRRKVVAPTRRLPNPNHDQPGVGKGRDFCLGRILDGGKQHPPLYVF